MKNKREYSSQKVLISALLCIYAFGLVKPVLPIVKDFLAHTFFKSSHTATVHYENGRYHLHLELSKEAQESGGKQNQVLADNDVLSFHEKNEAVLFTIYFQKISEIHSPYRSLLLKGFLETALLPPEC